MPRIDKLDFDILCYCITSIFSDFDIYIKFLCLHIRIISDFIICKHIVSCPHKNHGSHHDCHYGTGDPLSHSAFPLSVP